MFGFHPAPTGCTALLAGLVGLPAGIVDFPAPKHSSNPRGTGSKIRTALYLANYASSNKDFGTRVIDVCTIYSFMCKNLSSNPVSVELEQGSRAGKCSRLDLGGEPI